MDARQVIIDNTPYTLKDEELRENISEFEDELSSIGGAGSYLKSVSLGTSYTAELKEDISSGKFEIAKVGCYLTINGHIYDFAHPDYWLGTGDTECTTHHMVVVPRNIMVYSKKMNNTNTTTGGYVGSDMYTGNNSNTGLTEIKSIIETDFGNANILSHRERFSNAVSSEVESGSSWYDSTVDLMNEIMVYGSNIFTNCKKGITLPGGAYTIDKTQLELFEKRPDLIVGRRLDTGARNYWWLRGVVSSGSFAFVSTNGFANYNGADNTFGVRPAFAIC